MREQVLIEFYVDKKLKEEAEEIYRSLGMDLETALRMFMVRSRIEKRFPFEVH